VDQELTEIFWKSIDAARNRGERPDLLTFVNETASQRRLTPSEFNGLASRLAGAGTFTIAPFLADFVGGLATHLRPAIVFDPCVENPVLLDAALRGSDRASSGLGLVRRHDTLDLFQKLDSRADWQFSDSSALENGLPVMFDLVVSAPPMAMRTTLPLADGEPPYFRREYADLVISRSLSHMSPSGVAAYLVTDSFLWNDKRTTQRRQLADQGFFLNAALSVVGGFEPFTSIPSQLVLFSRTRSEQLFIGRLTESTAADVLLDNLVARKRGAATELGALVDADSYSGWNSFSIPVELSRVLDAATARALSSIGRVNRLSIKAADEVESSPNAIYVPAIGVGDVRLTPPQYEGRGRFEVFEIVLNPDDVSADYLAAWMSTPIGKMARRGTAVGDSLPHTRRELLQQMKVPVPSIPEQELAVATARQLDSVAAAVVSLQGDLWSSPAAAHRVHARIEHVGTSDPIKSWAAELPYPSRQFFADTSRRARTTKR
jgi:hypothetical protein